ncbi:hypothetical protein HYFRA_00004322 [Hymenoscyphus fraxineus]|uniref:DUF676 domain-containing protein n=1 Tax=Hymenoscyphus fraxineus TaxID=746836 RepID=A0A9N9KLN2_9HELO|nr:hypothetical protein HYFRA_00004322 [Hymenoscyphus fraxineus]
MDPIIQTTQDTHHLCVLIHGFWGGPKDLQVMAQTLQNKDPSLHILIAKSNNGNFTYDGIDIGGERICKEIEEEIGNLARDGLEVTKLSLVGYSLGGLIARYAAGLLYGKGVFERIEPVNFTTFVSPHLGVRAPLRGWQDTLWNVFGARTLLTSGWQLFMIDKFRDTNRPLLEILSDPNSVFMKGLEQFQRRTLYTNIANDRSAVYYTTSISSTDPFTNLDTLDLDYLPGYEDVILDPKTSFEEPELATLSFSARLVQRIKLGLRRAPFVVAFVAYIPIGILELVLNSTLSAIQSFRRIRRYELGCGEVDAMSYRVPLLLPSSIQGAMEDVYQNVNNAQSHEYLFHSSFSNSNSTSFSYSSVEEEEMGGSMTGVGMGGKVLALTPLQFRMIEELNRLGWRKWYVHIRKARHSHAAVIARTEKPAFEEGKVVLRHWVEEEFVF